MTFYLHSLSLMAPLSTVIGAWILKIKYSKVPLPICLDSYHSVARLKERAYLLPASPIAYHVPEVWHTWQVKQKYISTRLNIWKESSSLMNLHKRSPTGNGSSPPSSSQPLKTIAVVNMCEEILHVGFKIFSAPHSCMCDLHAIGII